MMVEILKDSGVKLEEKENFVAYRNPIIVKKDKNFIGNIDATNPKEHIICRCETVTEEEIVDALTREIKIDSIDAIKRRTRAGMGTCQGAFCGPRVRKLIAKTLNISEDEVKGVAPRSSDLHNRVKRIEIMKL